MKNKVVVWRDMILLIACLCISSFLIYISISVLEPIVEYWYNGIILIIFVTIQVILIGIELNFIIFVIKHRKPEETGDINGN